MIRGLAIAALVVAGCGGPRAPAPEPAGSTSAESGDAAVPEPPPPSCSIAVNEFLWAVEVHDSEKVRDDLVGECIDGSWTASQRRCVAAATEATALRACSIRSVVAIVLGSKSPDAEIGIAECDEVLGTYRRCILPTKEQPAKDDTAEALAETIAIWREGLSRPGGAAELQTRCAKIARNLKNLFKSEGCAE